MIVAELMTKEGMNSNDFSPLLDYIMTTPENFNPNLFREFLTDVTAFDNLLAAYEEKIYGEEGQMIPGEQELPTPIFPTDPSHEK